MVSVEALASSPVPVHVHCEWAVAPKEDRSYEACHLPQVDAAIMLFGKAEDVYSKKLLQKCVAYSMVFVNPVLLLSFL